MTGGYTNHYTNRAMFDHGSSSSCLMIALGRLAVPWVYNIQRCLAENVKKKKSCHQMAKPEFANILKSQSVCQQNQLKESHSGSVQEQKDRAIATGRKGEDRQVY